VEDSAAPADVVEEAVRAQWHGDPPDAVEQWMAGG
jgi:hypothetical protein